MIPRVPSSETRSLRPPSSPEAKVQLPEPASVPILTRSAVVDELTREFVNFRRSVGGNELGPMQAAAAARALVNQLQNGKLDFSGLGPTATSLLHTDHAFNIFRKLEELCIAETGEGIKKVCLSAPLTQLLQNFKPSYLRTAIIGLSSLVEMDLQPSHGDERYPFEFMHFPTVQTVVFHLLENAHFNMNAFDGCTLTAFHRDSPTEDSYVHYYDRSERHLVTLPLKSLPDPYNLLPPAFNTQTAVSPRLATISPRPSPLPFMLSQSVDAAVMPPRIQESPNEAAVLADKNSPPLSD